MCPTYGEIYGRYISMGILDEHDMDNPLLNWTDPNPLRKVDTMGFTAVGSAVFYKFGYVVLPFLLNLVRNIDARLDFCQVFPRGGVSRRHLFQEQRLQHPGLHGMQETPSCERLGNCPDVPMPPGLPADTR